MNRDKTESDRLSKELAGLRQHGGFDDCIPVRTGEHAPEGPVLVRPVADEEVSRTLAPLANLLPLSPGSVVAVTAVDPLSAAKLASDLAAWIAEGGTRTVVIDASLDRPTIAKPMSTDRDEGLVDVVAFGVSPSVAIKRTLAAGVSLMTSGSRTISEAEIFESERFAETLEALSFDGSMAIMVVPRQHLPLLVGSLDAVVIAGGTAEELVGLAESVRQSRKGRRLKVLAALISEAAVPMTPTEPVDRVEPPREETDQESVTPSAAFTPGQPPRAAPPEGVESEAAPPEEAEAAAAREAPPERETAEETQVPEPSPVDQDAALTAALTDREVPTEAAALTDWGTPRVEEEPPEAAPLTDREVPTDGTALTDWETPRVEEVVPEEVPPAERVDAVEAAALAHLEATLAEEEPHYSEATTEREPSEAEKKTAMAEPAEGTPEGAEFEPAEAAWSEEEAPHEQAARRRHPAAWIALAVAVIAVGVTLYKLSEDVFNPSEQQIVDRQNATTEESVTPGATPGEAVTTDGDEGAAAQEGDEAPTVGATPSDEPPSGAVESPPGTAETPAGVEAQQEEPPPSGRPVAPTGPGGPYRVFVSSHSREAAAEVDASSLRTRGIEPEIVMVDLGDRGVWYRVAVRGGFPSPASAGAHLRAIHGFGYEGAWVQRHTQ